ncbi:MAG: hypothetical protein ACOYJ6_13210 [Caulobacterales bacterium]|jgi:hypothetical protein
MPQVQIAFLPLTTPQALILPMRAAAVFVFAALKGYFDGHDPDPDYGKFDRADVRAIATAAALRADARDDLEAAVMKTKKALTERIASLGAALEARRKMFDAGAADEAGAAFALNRRENAAARAGPAPAYFADQLAQQTHLPDVLGPAGALLADSETRFSAARERADAILTPIAAALEAADRWLETA